MSASKRGTRRAGVLGALASISAVAVVAGCAPEPWRYVHELSTSMPARMTSVALTGDMPRGCAAVGQNGRVDMFQGAWGTWTFQQSLAPPPDVVGAFGMAVALDGDTLAVGAPHNESFLDGTFQNQIGYVEIFTRDHAGRWTPRQLVRPSPPTPPPGQSWPPPDANLASFSFGGSLALEGDTLVVGAPRFWDGVGRAFVFQRFAGRFTQVAELKEADTDQRFDANFGDSVRISGGTIAVSRPDTGANTPPPKAGKVYLYTASDAGWVEQQVLQRHPAAGPDVDGFGDAIALSGERLAVRHKTAVQLFERSGGAWKFAWQVAAGGPGARGTIALGDEPRVLAVADATSSVGTLHLVWPSSDAAGQPLELTRGAGHADAQGFGVAVAVKARALLAATALGPADVGAVLSYVDDP